MQLRFKPSLRPTSNWVISMIGGLSSFLLIADRSILNIRNTRWLLVGDSAQAYLAWEYFRKTPLLQWPLGSNPRFGVGFDSSIVFSDSIPLVAVLLKPLSKLVPGDVQYFGWWLLICLILQTFFSLQILSLLHVPRLAQLVALPLLVLQPTLLDRMTFDGYGHMALSAHWLILAAVWLFLRSTTTHAEWMALLLFSIGVTFYFFVIVGIFFAVWSARNVSIAPNRTHAGLEALRWTLLTGLSSILLVFLLGGFQRASLADSGLGVYRATIASLVDATTPTGQQWTRLLLPLDLATPPGGQEGFGYLGSGVIALVVVCAILSVRLVTTRNVKKFTPLLIVAVFFLVLSLSPRIGFATYDFVSYPLPPAAEAVLGVVRATGRFVWVPMYVVVFLTIAILSARFRSRKHVLVSVLLIAVVFQVVDSSVALSETRERFTQTNPSLLTDDPVWNEFVMDKSHLVSIPPLSNDPRWIDLAVLAHRNNMTTSAAYVSRKDEASFEDLVETTQQALELRKFRSDTLYVITNYPPNPETTKLFEESETGELMNVRVVQVEELTVVYSTSTGS